MKEDYLKTIAQMPEESLKILADKVKQRGVDALAKKLNQYKNFI